MYCPAAMLKGAVFLGLTFSLELALADFSESSPLHHFFNARLLAPNELQVSIAGNVKFGISETFEIGSQGLGLIGEVPNFSLKHQMFVGPTFETSFSGHFFWIDLDPNATNENGDNGDSTDSSRGSSKMLLSMHGITSTFRMDASQYINAGLFEIFMFDRSSEYNSTSTLHILTPVIGYDLFISRQWAFSSILAYPVFAYVQLNSDLADIEGTLDLISGIPSNLNPSMVFLTLTRSWHEFNLEFGLFGVAGNLNPYLNLFWRLR